MSNLQSKIGLRPLDEGSGRQYVDDLTNVDYNLLAAIASDAEKIEDGGDGVEFLWSKIKAEQYKCLKADVLAEFAKRANFQEVVARTPPPTLIGASGDVTTTEDDWYGIWIKLPTCRYQSLYLHSVFFQTDSAETTIRIQSLSGGLLQEIPASIEAGQITLKLDIPLDTYQGEQVLVSVFIPAGTVLRRIGYRPIAYTSNSCVVYRNAFDFATPGGYTYLSHSYIGLDYEIRLSIDRVIDGFAERLARSYALLCGADIIKKAIQSQKASVMTLINRIGMQDNYDMTVAEYRKEVGGALRSIYKEVEKEKIALVSNPQDQPGYYITDAF